MRVNTVFAACLGLLAASMQFACGQDTPVADSRDLASGRPPRIIGCDRPEDRRVSIKSPFIEQQGPVIRARNGVQFDTGHKHLKAQSVEWNTQAATGTLTKATFTTCNSAKPDWHLTAQDVSLLPNNKLRARRVSLYLGNFRVLALPSIKMRVGGRSASRNVFPRPGFDKTDGVTLSQDFRFVDEDRLRANADLRLTSNNGVQGQVYSAAGINGELIDLPGRFFSYDFLRSGVLTLPPQTDETCPVVQPPDPRSANLRGFGRFTLRQRTYDIVNTGLVVYRQPELGVTYIGDHLYSDTSRPDPRLEIYPQVTASWGRFKESPGQDKYLGRTNIDVLLARNVLSMGPNTALQPMVMYDWSAYGNSDNHQVFGYGLDISHIWPTGSAAFARYIRLSESGATPFQFDNVDIARQLQVSGMLQLKKHIFGLAIGYDFDNGSVYDWEVMYGWRSDCLQASVRYDQRLERLAFDVGLINL